MLPRKILEKIAIQKVSHSEITYSRNSCAVPFFWNLTEKILNVALNIYFNNSRTKKNTKMEANNNRLPKKKMKKKDWNFMGFMGHLWKGVFEKFLNLIKMIMFDGKISKFDKNNYVWWNFLHFIHLMAVV